WEKAVTYLAEAGSRAAERSAHREAAAAFEQGLVGLGQLPESHRTLEQAVDIRLALHTSYYAVAELKRAHQTLCDAELPARKLGDPRRAALLASQTGQSLWVTGRSREALPLFEHAAATVRSYASPSAPTDPTTSTLAPRWTHDPIKVLGKTLGDFALLTSTTLYIGAARFALGDFAVAEESFRHVIHALGESAAGGHHEPRARSHALRGRGPPRARAQHHVVARLRLQPGGKARRRRAAHRAGAGRPGRLRAARLARRGAHAAGRIVAARW